MRQILVSSYPKLNAVQESVLLHDISQLSKLVATWVLVMASEPSLRPCQRIEKHPEIIRKRLVPQISDLLTLKQNQNKFQGFK